MRSENCSEIIQQVGFYSYQRYQGQFACYLMASPQGVGSTYRSPILTDEGMFMIFNSYQNQRASDGARVFYFFPRERIPNFEIVQGQPVLRSSTNGIDILMSPRKVGFLGMNGGVLREAPVVSPQNKGGIEISKVKTLWLDAGFMLGADPTADLSSSSRFTDLDGRTCVVKNKEIFTAQGSYDSYFHFTDEELKKFLAKRCPQLKVNW